MDHLTEERIASWAVNATALANGRELARGNAFTNLGRSADGTFYQGECRGSGSRTYLTCVDFLNPSAPFFSCTCPSRQVPCKHTLGLLFCLLDNRPFTEQPLSGAARARRTLRSRQDTEGTGSAPKAKTAAGRAARTKKIRRQLEGLDLCDRLLHDLLQQGLGALGGTSLATFRNLARDLGNFHLPGPQRLVLGLLEEAALWKEHGDDAGHTRMLGLLEELWSLIGRARPHLREQLDRDDPDPDSSFLYEALGGVWKFNDLARTDSVLEDACLAQLAFWVADDPLRGQYADTGCWINLADGELLLSCNFRPYKALKHVRPEDSFLGVLETPLAVLHPGPGIRRVRWEQFRGRGATAEDVRRIRSTAAPSLAPELKAAKNQLKNPLSPPHVFRLLAFRRLGLADGAPVLLDAAGDTVLCRDAPDLAPSTDALYLLPDPAMAENQVLLGAFWHDVRENRIFLHPLSIVGEHSVIRLLC